MVENGDLDDPLLRFVGQLEQHAFDGYTETVNLAPLFSCQGAIAEIALPGPDATLSFSHRLSNARRVAELVQGTAWQPLVPEEEFRSGILLLQNARPEARRVSPEALRASFHEQGLVLTAYEEGVIRLSMPMTPWQGNELDLIRNSLQFVG